MLLRSVDNRTVEATGDPSKHELAPQSFGDLAKEEYRNISHNAAHPPPQPQPAVGPDNIWGRLYNSCPISFTMFVIGFIATTVFTPCAIWGPQLFRSAALVCGFVIIWACLSCRRYHPRRSAAEQAGDVPLREIDVIGSTLPELVSLISDLKDLYASLPCMTLIADQFSKLLWFTVG
ncbi:hypothetical protein CDV31_013838 [Fusarium ambrosium]|uniref:Uncharacterized protein n=1 Tax=Fusarium ambrosium TaxID=131363 RepID=A0A428T0H0_9HYPO|nr:hypothetical protein CDV31_013838 [Fusarium ambrosium]